MLFVVKQVEILQNKCHRGCVAFWRVWFHGFTQRCQVCKGAKENLCAFAYLAPLREILLLLIH